MNVNGAVACAELNVHGAVACAECAWSSCMC